MLKKLDIIGGFITTGQPNENKLVVAGATTLSSVNGVSSYPLAVIDLNNSQPILNFNPILNGRIYKIINVGSKVLICGQFSSVTYGGITYNDLGGIILFNPVTLEFTKAGGYDVVTPSPGQMPALIKDAVFYSGQNRVYICGYFIYSPTGEAIEITGIASFSFDGSNLTFINLSLPDWTNPPMSRTYIPVLSLAIDDTNGILYSTLSSSLVNSVDSGYGATFDVSDSDPNIFIRRPWHLGLVNGAAEYIFYPGDGFIYVSYNYSQLPRPFWASSNTGQYLSALTTCSNGNCLPTASTSMNLDLGGLIVWPRVTSLHVSGDNVFIGGYFRNLAVDDVAFTGGLISGFACYNKTLNKITSGPLNLINPLSFGSYYTTMGTIGTIVEHDNKIHAFGSFQWVDYNKNEGQIIFNKNNGTRQALLTLPLNV